MVDDKSLVEQSFKSLSILEHKYTLYQAKKTLNITVRINEISDAGIKRYANAIRKIIDDKKSKIA